MLNRLSHPGTPKKLFLKKRRLEQKYVTEVTYWNNKEKLRGAWVAQSVKHLTLAQVMISRFTGSSPALGSVLAVQSLLRILCLPLSAAPPPLVLSLKIN